MAESQFNDEEEQSLLKQLTVHLPDHWSDEQRDAYLQQMLANIRKHREHSQEEELMMEKYFNTIKEKFRPQSPELYDFKQWPIDEKLLKMLANNSLDPDVMHQIDSSELYTFSFLPPSFCTSVINELSYIEQWSIDNGLKLRRPNTMNNYGIILDHFGFEQCLDDLMKTIIEPLTRLVYKHVTLPLDSHHGFIVEYAMNKDRKLDFHVDDSAVTLNVCLGTEFTGGELLFGGIRCPTHTPKTKPKAEEEIILEHQVGTACLHLGNHRHQALPINSGRRLNLILWCRSTTFSRELDQLKKNECPTWCGSHQNSTN